MIETMLDPQIATRPDWTLLRRFSIGVNNSSNYTSKRIKEMNSQEQIVEPIFSKLPTIKSVESEGTYTQSSNQSNFLERTVIRQPEYHTTNLPIKTNPVTTIRYSSPPKQVTCSYTPRPQPVPANRFTINSPQSHPQPRQISFNIVSSPNRSTVPSYQYSAQPGSNLNIFQPKQPVYQQGNNFYHSTSPLGFSSTFGKSLPNQRS